jgi:hypothetical protein
MMKTSAHKFVPKQFLIAKDMAEFLRDMAYKRKVSQAQLVRAAIREFAKNNSKTKLAPEPASMNYDD